VLTFLRQIKEAAGALALINDLRRCRMGYVLAWGAARVLSMSPVVRVDAPRSVEAAFTMDEIRRLAADAGMTDAEIRRCWPCRFQLSWRRREG
jgi:hypothetical protein